MEFKDGVNVYTAEGKHVGKIDRVVLDPRNDEAMDVVVREGVLFSMDKVVPVNLIASATEDRVVLRKDAGDLDALPDFQETSYVGTGEPESSPGAGARVSTLYWYPPVGMNWWAASGNLGYFGYAIPSFVVETDRNIPEGTVALREGARVVSSDGRHAGNVAAVFTETEDDRVTHILLSEGFLLRETKLIPTTWISTVRENEVHLTVASDVIKGLPEYQPPI